MPSLREWAQAAVPGTPTIIAAPLDVLVDQGTLAAIPAAGAPTTVDFGASLPPVPGLAGGVNPSGVTAGVPLAVEAVSAETIAIALPELVLPGVSDAAGAGAVRLSGLRLRLSVAGGELTVRIAGTGGNALLSSVAVDIDGTPVGLDLPPDRRIAIDDEGIGFDGAGLRVDGVPWHSELTLPSISLRLGHDGSVTGAASAQTPARAGLPPLTVTARWDGSGATPLAPTTVSVRGTVSRTVQLAGSGQLAVNAALEVELGPDGWRLAVVPGNGSIATLTGTGPQAGLAAALGFAAAAAAEAPSDGAGGATLAALAGAAGGAAGLLGVVPTATAELDAVRPAGEGALEVDYTVSLEVNASVTPALGAETLADGPVRISVRGARVSVGSGSGLAGFALSFEGARTELADGGRWRVMPEQLPLRVGEIRSGHGSSWIDLDLHLALDLGVVSVEDPVIRIRLDGSPPSLTALGISVSVPGLLSGSGRAELGTGIRAALSVSLVPLDINAAATFAYEPASPGEDVMVSLGLACDFPGPLPLANSGLGLFGVAGMFGHNARRRLPAVQDPIDAELKWMPHEVERKTGAELLGLSAVVGTLPDLGFICSALTRVTVATPDFMLAAALDARFMTTDPPNVAEANQSLDPPAAGGFSVRGLLSVSEEAVHLGLRGEYLIPKLIEATVPVQAHYPFEGEGGYLHVGTDGRPGREGAPVSVRVLPGLFGAEASAYLMVHDNGLPNLGSPPFDLGGFAVAIGVDFERRFGAGPIYARVHAGAVIGLGTNPLLLVGDAGIDGELRLGPIGIGLHAGLRLQVGPGDVLYANARVCGEVDLFFFSIEGCATIEIGGQQPGVPVPENPFKDLVLQTRDGLAEPAGAAVWPDAIPTLTSAHPVKTGLSDGPFHPSLTAEPAPVGNWEVGNDKLKYTHTLTGLTLDAVAADGTGTPVADAPAAWQLPVHGQTFDPVEPPVAGARQLCLMTWEPHVWSRALARGGQASAGDPIQGMTDVCARREPVPGWLLGQRGKPFTETSWIVPPEAHSDPLVSEPSAYLLATDGKTQLSLTSHAFALSFPGLPQAIEPMRAHPVAIEAQADRPEGFEGVLLFPRLVGFGVGWEFGGLDPRLDILLESEVFGGRLLLWAEDRDTVRRLRVGTAQAEHVDVQSVEANPSAGHILTFALPDGTDQIRIRGFLPERVGLVGIYGLTAAAKQAADDEAAARGAQDAAWSAQATPTSGASRPLLAADTTYRVSADLSWSGTAIQPDSSSSDDTGSHATFERQFRTLNASEARSRSSELARYVAGFTPVDDTALVLRDDPLCVHLSVDYLQELLAAYDLELRLLVRRSDPPPQAPSHLIVLDSLQWSLGQPLALELLAQVEQRLALASLDAGRAFPECALPRPAGASLTATAALAPLARYELVAVAADAGGSTVGELGRVRFGTSRYRSTSDLLAASGLGASTPATDAGSIQLASAPTGISASWSDTALLDSRLEALGLGRWPQTTTPRTTLLLAPGGLIAGVYVEALEPLHRPGRVELDAVTAAGIGGRVLRDAGGTRLLALLDQPASAPLHLTGTQRSPSTPAGQPSSPLDAEVMVQP